MSKIKVLAMLVFSEASLLGGHLFSVSSHGLLCVSVAYFIPLIRTAIILD